MNKSLALKNKLYLFFGLIISLFIFLYLIYFLINAQISFFQINNQNAEFKITLSQLSQKNDLLTDKIKRLQTNTIDLDFLDEKIREKIGLLKEDELLITFD